MRQFKFRAWDIVTKKMLNWEDKGGGLQDSISLSDILNGALESYRVMQFTGLKDNNKVDIYEEDFVECSGCNDICIVYYDSVIASYIALPYWLSYECWSNDDESDPDEYLLWDNNNIKVIGNRFENKYEDFVK
jgi:uncharacterized phage protein (TIGR01671 family)